jgi:hypothetical protein
MMLDARKANSVLNYRLVRKGRAESVRIEDPGVNPRCDWWNMLDYRIILFDRDKIGIQNEGRIRHMPCYTIVTVSSRESLK